MLSNKKGGNHSVYNMLISYMKITNILQNNMKIISSPYNYEIYFKISLKKVYLV